MQRLAVFLMIAAACASTVGGVHAATLISVTDSTASSGVFLGGAGADHQVVMAPWTITEAASNVSIQAEFFSLGSNTIEVWLTNQIGPGTNVSNEFARGSYLNPTGTLILFSGLTLQAGTYYLVADGDGSDNALWVQSTNATVFTDPRASAGVPRFAAQSVDGSTSVAAYRPASVTVPFGDASTRLLFQVTGDFTNSGGLVPEPSVFWLFAIGLACFVRRFRF